MLSFKRFFFVWGTLSYRIQIIFKHLFDLYFRPLTGTTTLLQSGPGSNDNEGYSTLNRSSELEFPIRCSLVVMFRTPVFFLGGGSGVCIPPAENSQHILSPINKTLFNTRGANSSTLVTGELSWHSGSCWTANIISEFKLQACYYVHF